MKTVEKLLLDKRVMLRDYFSLTIDDSGALTTIPMLLKDYMPSLGKLPAFLLRLGPNVSPSISPGLYRFCFQPSPGSKTKINQQVDWTSELECFDQFLRELALFYVPPPSQQRITTSEPSSSQPPTSEPSSFPDETIERTLFPAFRRRLIPTTALLGCVTEIANLKGLYRIFERSC